MGIRTTGDVSGRLGEEYWSKAARTRSELADSGWGALVRSGGWCGSGAWRLGHLGRLRRAISRPSLTVPRADQLQQPTSTCSGNKL